MTAETTVGLRQLLSGLGPTGEHRFFHGIDEDRYVEGEGILDESASQELRIDDFDGDEGFYARPTDLDACGEPRSFADGARIEDGGIDATIDRVISEGDIAVVLQRGRAETHSGMAYNNDYAQVFTVRDGRIVAVKEYMDTALVDAVFGPAQ